MIKKTYILLSFTLLFAGCVREETVECRSGVRLHYYYDLNPDYRNRFDTDVNEMALFVFDSETGLFYDYYHVNDPAQLSNDNLIYLPLPDGKWDIVTWASGIKGFGYRYYGMGTVNPGEPESPYNYGMKKGETHIDDMRLWIKNHTATGDGHRLVSDGLSNLYHGEVFGVETRTTAEPTPIVDVPIICNSSTLRLIVHGLPQSEIAALTVTADMRNGRYTHDNQVGRYAFPIYYRNGEWTDDEGGGMRYDMAVLRSFINDDISTLVLSNPLLADYGARDGVITIPIVPTIMENPAYRTQAALDRENLYIFEVDFGTGGGAANITVTINGWQVVNVIPGIS